MLFRSLPGDIAIIYRENSYGEDLSRYLGQLGIPVYSKRNLNILEVPLARKVILLLDYLVAEHDIPYGGDEMLFELLHADWFGIPALEIAKLSMEVADKRFTGDKTSLRRWLAEKAAAPQADLFSTGINQNLKAASQFLEELIADVPNLTVQQLFEKIVRKSGILSKVMQQPDKFHQLQVISGLFDFIRDETRRNPTIDRKSTRLNSSHT